MSGFLQTPPELPDSWASDEVLRSVVRFHLGDETFAAAEPELAEMGRIASAPETRAMSRQAELEPPVHKPYSTWGERVDEIWVSPNYKALGRIGIEAGVTALPYEGSPYGDAARIVWGALISLWGPSSALYSCPVAMTDGAARTLLDFGGAAEREVVERLTTRDPQRAWTSGQWMTETAGGSDVGRTGTVARRDGGQWRLHGTKWFTSSTTSEMALTLARPEGAPEGSRGLSLFRVHRNLEDGTRNNIFVRRLKDKLGTRALPTAELELQGALAFPVGDPSEGGGVKRIATMLNITRVHNSLGGTAAIGRGLAWAGAYAEVREVFGRRLIDQPAHRATLIDMAVDYAASLALTVRCCELLGRVEQGGASEGEETLLRGLTPLTKMATGRWSIAAVTEAMEAIGGVGYCEDSGMPALVRNTHVIPIWEGTSNVMALDFLRAAARDGALSALISDGLDAAGRAAEVPELAGCADSVKAAFAELQSRAESFIDEEDAQANARSLAMGLATTYACARLSLLGADGARRGERKLAAFARRLAARGLVGSPAPEDLTVL